ncbi:uncharacterized protein FA14DRAFT_80748 [Meira miltonrushii]|uniref:Uncharacterized protein n=1 Tax=Meira miltonrushii TaxID=1280837 RepID=A0A316V7N7_9BASI|nr:uncharacterized protein FA14DRAFT_80748 [Meira miltonrushii]PWN33038.1 hypothetical protein FA14DRAFT_80748 [Meira miltonrushii]
MKKSLFLAIILAASTSLTNCLPATNNNQASRQVQRATQGRVVPPPVSLGRIISPQQRVSGTGPTRHSPRLAAQRQAPYHAQGSPPAGQQGQGSHTTGQQVQHTQVSIHPGTAPAPATRGQIAQQRRLAREEQRGLHQVSDLQTPQTRGRTRNTQPQASLHATPAPQQTGHQPARTPVQRTAQVGVTPTRQRGVPEHGLREIPPASRRTGGHQAAQRPTAEQNPPPEHRRPGSWVQVENPPTAKSRMYQAGLKTPTKKE